MAMRAAGDLHKVTDSPFGSHWNVVSHRAIQHIEALPEEQVYQVLDYIEFLDSKYGPRNAPAPNPLTRFAEGVESTLRAGKVSANAISGTMNIMNKVVGGISEVAAAGKSVATGLMDVASGTAGTADPAAQPPSIPRGGPHELGSQLPHTPGEETK